MKPMIFDYATPESQGIDSQLLIKALESARDSEPRGIEIHDFLLMRHGKLVYEGYMHPYGPDVKHMIFSQTKSFMSTAIGIAIGDGKLTLDDAVIDYFPEIDRSTLCENAKRMRVRHLMSMSSGHDKDTMDAYVEGGAAAYFALPVPHEPGSHFFYNTGNSNIMGMIAERVTGCSMYDYLKPRVFDKVGIEIQDGDWLRVHGACSGGFGLQACAMDVMRLANLYLLDGCWQGEQLIPKDWVKEVSTKQVQCINSSPSWGAGYTFQFWNCDYADAYRIDGAGGQQAAIVPSKDMVILFNSALHGEVSDFAQVLARHFVMPAVHAHALPENPDALSRLHALRDQLQTPKAQSYQAIPSCAMGRFVAQQPDAGVQSITLSPIAGGMRALFELDKGPVVIDIGLDGVRRLYKNQLDEKAFGLPEVTMASKGSLDGNRLIARATQFPNIATFNIDLEATQEGLTVMLQAAWFPPLLSPGAHKFVRA